MESFNSFLPGKNQHFVVIPWLAQGHMIPMTDIARLLAHHGVTVSLITTPANFLRIKATADRMLESKLPIHFIRLPFPSVDFGLPEGCENMDSLPSKSSAISFYDAAKMLRRPLIDHLRSPETIPPTCIISDSGHTWTTAVSREFNLPRLIFQGYSCFATLCNENLLIHKTHETVSSDSEPFVLPGLPQQIEITRPQLPAEIRIAHLQTDIKESVPRSDGIVIQFQRIQTEIRESVLRSDGIVINSFDEMEIGYSRLLEQSTGKKAWMIGPVSLCNQGGKDLAERGDKASIDSIKCKTWLDSMSSKSVLYVCFGSMGKLAPSQLIELGSGLLASNKPFIWVIKSVQDPETDNWLSDNFSDESRCLLIKGWAPQPMILSHAAIGGFLTHCGWNSTLEGVCAGLPLLTWPMFAEQFLNEKLAVDVLKIGVSIGVKTPTEFAGDVKDEVVVGWEEIAKAVKRLMEEGEEAEGRRMRAKEYAEKAKRALEEGGSSYLNLTSLIQYALDYKGGKNDV